MSPPPSFNFSTGHWVRAGLLGLALVGFAVAGALWVNGGFEGGLLRAQLEAHWLMAQQAPAPLFFTAMVFGCLLPIPASFFYVAAGSLYGLKASLGWITLALLINMTLAHRATATWLRPYLVRWIERSGQRMPAIRKPADEVLVILLVRLTPGVPWFVQNMSLGLSGARLAPVLLLSLPIQLVFASLYATVGISALEGRLGLAFTALFALFALSLAARFAYLRLRRDAVRAGAAVPEDVAAPGSVSP